MAKKKKAATKVSKPRTKVEDLKPKKDPTAGVSMSIKRQS